MESISVKERMVILYMKTVEAMFIASDVDTVRKLLSERFGLDIAKSWVNGTHHRGGALLVADRPVVRLDAVVSEAQAMPTVQAILRASRNTPGIELMSIGISRSDSRTPRLRESLPPRTRPRQRLRAA
jgi:hypothetical protein